MGAMGVDELAQRALADVFEQLERIGAAGRERCRGDTYASTPRAPVTRAEALGFIRVAENALDYARVHLDYLRAPPDRERSPLAAGERVEVMDREAGAWLGTLHGLSSSGSVFVRRDEDGAVVECHPRDVERAPSEAAE